MFLSDQISVQVVVNHWPSKFCLCLLLSLLINVNDNNWQILERATTYDEALKQAISTPTIAPVYFIVGGLKPQQGAIVVRSGENVANVTHLGDNSNHT